LNTVGTEPAATIEWHHEHAYRLYLDADIFIHLIKPKDRIAKASVEIPRPEATVVKQMSEIAAR
jgi:hypothetical protein